MNCILIKNVSKNYRYPLKSFGAKGTVKQVKALINFNLEIKTPKIVGIVGKKNCGKTTLFKICTGSTNASSGEVKILGYKPNAKDAEFLHEIGVASVQKISSNISLSVEDSLLLSGYLYNMSVQETKHKIDQLLKKFKFQSLLKTSVNQLSSVEKIKFELISILIHSPKIIFVDNLIDELNNSALQEIQNILKQHFNEEKICMLFTSANIENLKDFCQEIVELS